jgi:multidrug efflux pump subunit AcrB
LAETVRASYYGAEVMRLQRGRHEVKLMVRYPRSERRSLAAFRDIRVRTGDGAERPLTELADVRVRRGYSEINRVDQKRAITVTADVNEDIANARNITQDLQASFMPQLLDQHQGVSVRWEGQQEQTQESVNSMAIGFLAATCGMFVLLTVQFRSYLQPLLVLFIIPFGFIGAVAGHALLQMDLTIFSLFGLIALTGVVVNDSIVLIDAVNRRIRGGVPYLEALLDAGRTRFRPVVLTSITTVAGLTPMLLETSFQAQVLIPMATSVCFGLLFATALVLLLIPTFYVIYLRLTGQTGPAPESAIEGATQLPAPAHAAESEREVAVR